jgi:hypothetical protein
MEITDPLANIKSKPKKDYMSPSVAKYLISEFERQFSQLKLNDNQRSELVTALETTPVLESSKFYEEPSNGQKYSKRQDFKGDTDRKVYLYPSRILRNENAANLQKNFIKSIEEWAFSTNGYNSHLESRRARKDKEIVRLMLDRAKSEDPLMKLSLLFHYEQKDIEEEANDKQTYIELDIPKLIIPGATDSELETIIHPFERREGKVKITTNYGERFGERIERITYGEYITRLTSKI